MGGPGHDYDFSFMLGHMIQFSFLAGQCNSFPILSPLSKFLPKELQKFIMFGQFFPVVDSDSVML